MEDPSHTGNSIKMAISKMKLNTKNRGLQTNPTSNRTVKDIMVEVVAASLPTTQTMVKFTNFRT